LREGLPEVMRIAGEVGMDLVIDTSGLAIIHVTYQPMAHAAAIITGIRHIGRWSFKNRMSGQFQQ
jgi:hypothetical protein